MARNRLLGKNFKFNPDKPADFTYYIGFWTYLEPFVAREA
jgi:hypothetical protein